MRRLLKAIGSAIVSHKVMTLGVTAVLAIGLAAGFGASIQEGATFDGTSRPGGHQWWDLGDLQTFCTNCHYGVGQEIIAGPHVAPALSDCSFCHSPSGGQHAARVPWCTDCHSTQGGELSGDAHAGILTDLGEDPTAAALTCKACHTHVEVNLTSSPLPPLELVIGN